MRGIYLPYGKYEGIHVTLQKCRKKSNVSKNYKNNQQETLDSTQKHGQVLPPYQIFLTPKIGIIKKY